MGQGQIVNARVTFQSMPVHMLEKFTFKDRSAALRELRRQAGLDECVIVQTCNRVEVYGTARAIDVQKISRAWASLAGMSAEDAERAVEFSTGRQVADHLLRLTSGLDSMVIGEEQILGQIRESLTAARTSGASGQYLNKLFDSTMRTGARIRSSTGLNPGGTSIGSMAVRLAEENVDGLGSRAILLIGTGETSSLVAKSLARRGYDFFVASRTPERSRAFCETMGRGRPVRFEETLADFGRYDVIFSAASAPYMLVTSERIKGAKRPGGMMIIDLSNPRTVDEAVAQLSGVKLMNLDQIAELADKGARRRDGKVRAVEEIISEEVPVIQMSINRLSAEPIVKGVFQAADDLRQKEVSKALGMLGDADERTRRIIEDLSKSIVEGVVSAPMNNLRRASEDGKDEMLDAASRLFDYGRRR